MKRWCAEFLGTWFLVFAGTGAVVIDRMHGGVIGHAGVALTFGLVVLAMIHTFGDISGAHLNPAVTAALAAAGRFPLREVPGYVLAQCAGGLAASGVLGCLFPGAPGLGETVPAGPAAQSFVLEFLLTAVLMMTVLQSARGGREQGWTAGIAIGAVVALEAMFAGPVSGASMNPARSLGPALASGHCSGLWIYLTAPLAGALAAVPVCGFLHGGTVSSPSPDTSSTIS